MPRRVPHSLAVQTVRYLIVGGVVFCIDIALFATFLAYAGNQNYLAANAMAKIITAVVAFCLHKKFTFVSEYRYGVRKQFARYIMLVLFNMSLSMFILYIFVSFFSFPEISSRVSADIIVIIVAFVLSRNVVFPAIFPE